MKPNTEELVKRFQELFSEIKETCESANGQYYDDIIQALAKSIPGNEEVDSISAMVRAQDLSHKEKTLCIESGFYRIRDEDVFRYLGLLYDIEVFLNAHRPNRPTGKEPLEAAANWIEAYRAVQKLKDYGNGELYERIQCYRSDLEKVTAG